MNKRKLYQRFSKDYNLPINIFNEEIFEYYKELYKDFFPVETLDNVIKLIETKYDGNVELWLDYCGSVRDNAIETLLNDSKYKEFNTSDIKQFDIEVPCPERSCYSEATNGCYFLSIDLKKANFQALKYVGVLEDETYEKFIKRMGGDEYIANSKYLRQVIFGKLNPSRQIKVEKYLMRLAYEAVRFRLKNEGFVIYSFNSDELVFSTSGFTYDESHKDSIKNIIEDITGILNRYLNLEVKVEFNYIERLNIKNSNGNTVDAYVKKNCITGKETLKKASTTFYPQIYKLYKGLEINELDKTFFFENQLATFNEEIKLV